MKRSREGGGLQEVLDGCSDNVQAKKAQFPGAFHEAEEEKEDEKKEEQEEASEWIVAIHGGVSQGYLSAERLKKTKVEQDKACRSAETVLRGGGLAEEAVRAAIESLERDGISNCGRGSSLNMDGKVECDASIMVGSDGSFGAVGAAPCIASPISVALALRQQASKGLMSLGRVPPIMLVGDGARRWAESQGLEVGSEEDNVTTGTRENWKKYTERLASFEKSRAEQEEALAEGDANNHDTVGAVVLDGRGNIAAGVSSGGLNLNVPGRVGEAAVFGCGCWADNGAEEGGRGVGTSCTGTGEEVMLRQLASSSARMLCLAGNDGAVTTPHDGFRRIMGPREGEHAEWGKHGKGKVKRWLGVLAMTLDRDPGGDGGLAQVIWSHTGLSLTVSVHTSCGAAPAFCADTKEEQYGGVSVSTEGLSIPYRKARRGQ